MTVDLDSTICEVHGHAKHGAGYGYTHRLGYHPLLATRADTGEVLHARLRRGSANTARGVKRFTEELIARLRRSGAPAALCVRADSGFWSHDLIDTLRAAGVGWSITVRVNPKIHKAIAGIIEDDWEPITYPEGGQAQVAETTYAIRHRGRLRCYRLIVRRVRHKETDQQALWADWRYHAFVTSSTADAFTADQFHRDHAVVELAIRDLKEGAGMEHVPSGRFFANAAWLACAVLAHNICRWSDHLGGTRHADQLTVARTLRTRLLNLPGRLVNRHGQPTLRLPSTGPGPPPSARHSAPSGLSPHPPARPQLSGPARRRPPTTC